jgi:hypothetical protein
MSVLILNQSCSKVLQFVISLPIIQSTLAKTHPAWTRRGRETSNAWDYGLMKAFYDLHEFLVLCLILVHQPTNFLHDVCICVYGWGMYGPVVCVYARVLCVCVVVPGNVWVFVCRGDGDGGWCKKTSVLA